MTQGDLVMSMDQLLTKPRLGTCFKFYMQSFTLANGGRTNLHDSASQSIIIVIFILKKPYLMLWTRL